MSELQLSPMSRMGFDFNTHGDKSGYQLPIGSSESDWRMLTSDEILILENSGNRADDWKNLRVGEGFTPARIEDCRFYGRVFVGRLSDSFLQYNDLRLPVGLYSSTIVSSSIADDAAIHNVSYMARMAVGKKCLIFNVNEIITTDHAKFGNGIVMDGEDEEVRIWLEIANENGGRRVLPFDGMLPADAWIWSRYRSDEALMERFLEMTDRICSPKRGGYGNIGSGSVIKDCRILKDVKIGESAYIKGCNKLKNLTINSDSRRPTQLGEGCELVNGIIGYSCRVFYGVKAVRFILNDHSTLKYGARLINSILGSNSTISCCEVLNSLIFGSHEQHHNSSFLCASVLKGQSNMASAATVGSNHNSRASDGEIIADRGFWPGLSTSLKHNSRFAAFTLIAKGAYPAELDIPLPFCLVSNDETHGELHLMPGYWFRYNLYALARNASKSAARDGRDVKHQELEFDWLAPDTVMQMLGGLQILENWADDSPAVKEGLYASGRELLESDDNTPFFTSHSYPVENSRRPVRILHAGRCWRDYRRMIRFWCVREFRTSGDDIPVRFAEEQSTGTEITWINIGGQQVSRGDLEDLKTRVRSGEVREWSDMHAAYREIDGNYQIRKLQTARMILPLVLEGMDTESLLSEARSTAGFIYEGIRESRKKDYSSHFRNITFSDSQERDAVLGCFDDNDFVRKAEADYNLMLELLVDRNNGFEKNQR